MSYVKTFTIFTLISMSISFVLFLFFGSLNPGTRSFEVVSKNLGDATKSPGVLQKLAGNFSKVLGAQTSKKEGAGQNSSGQNLTELFAKQLVGQIINKNPDGARNIDGNLSLVMPENLFESAAIEESALFMFQNSGNNRLSASDLNVTNTTSKNELIRYVKSVNLGAFKSLESSGFGTSIKTIDDFVKNELALIEASKSFKEVLYAMPVPTPFVNYHLEVLRAVDSQEIIASNFLDHKEDPLRAIISFEAQKKLDAKYNQLSDTLVELINKYQLPIKREDLTNRISP